MSSRDTELAKVNALRDIAEQLERQAIATEKILTLLDGVISKRTGRQRPGYLRVGAINSFS